MIIVVVIISFIAGFFWGAVFMYNPTKEALDSGFVSFDGVVYKVEKVTEHNIKKGEKDC